MGDVNQGLEIVGIAVTIHKFYICDLLYENLTYDAKKNF